MKKELLFYCETQMHLVALNAKDRCQCIPKKFGKPIPSMYTTTDYKKSKAALKDLFTRVWNGRPLFDGEVYVIIYSNYLKHDGDAHLKIIFDALQGSVITNDNQITKHTLEKMRRENLSVTVYARENLLPVYSNNVGKPKNPFD